MNPLQILLRKLPEMKASDLHISASMPPLMRINGLLKPLKTKPFPPEATEKLIFSILTEKQRETFLEKWDLDFCYDIPGVGRYRANVLKQRKGIDSTLR